VEKGISENKKRAWRAIFKDNSQNPAIFPFVISNRAQEKDWEIVFHSSRFIMSFSGALGTMVRPAHGANICRP